MDVLAQESAEPAGCAAGRLAFAGPDRLADAVASLATELGAAGRGDTAALAAIATALWMRALKFDAADPHWPDRDRFIVSSLGGDGLLPALLGMSGCPAATGAEPPFDRAGDGIGAAVGMALAERLLASRFGKSLVDHRTWVLADGDCLTAGISHEAASIAGRLRLDKLAILLRADAADPEEIREAASRFAACGWAVQRVAAEAPGGIASALSFALRAKKPTLIAVEALPSEEEAAGDGDAATRWQRAGARGSPARRAWLKRLTRHAQRAEFERAIEGRLPPAWQEVLAVAKAGFSGVEPAASCAEAGRQIFCALSAAVPEIVGGFAGAAEPPAGVLSVRRGAFAGRAVLYGHRAQAAPASAAGMAAHGGILPVATCADGDAPALRRTAALHQRTIHVVAETVPASSGLAGLRAIPGLLVLRPADAIETAECWEVALRRDDGPSLLVLGEAPGLLRDDALLPEPGAANRCVRGGYVLAGVEGERQATLIGGGGEIAALMAARQALAACAVATAVVSLPCWELFERMPPAYREAVLGQAPRFGIAACGFGWERWLGADGRFIALPDPALPETGAGPVADAIVARVLKRVDASCREAPSSDPAGFRVEDGG